MGGTYILMKPDPTGFGCHFCLGVCVCMGVVNGEFRDLIIIISCVGPHRTFLLRVLLTSLEVIHVRTMYRTAIRRRRI